MTREGLSAFAALLQVAEERIDLGRGALEVARVEYPDIVPAEHLGRLDDLAARSGAGAESEPLRVLHRLREFLFAEEGFRGNSADYYDPRNSCLNDVLDRKLGIPITLSVLLMEVGRRAGLAVDGVGLPGHFVVSVEVGDEPVLLDPFHGGRVLTREQADGLVTRALGRRVRLVDTHFVALPRRQILARMLRNLLAIYMRGEAWDRALAVLDRFILVDEECGAHVRTRGAIRVRLGQLESGAEDFERYLRRCPEAPDAGDVRRDLQKVRQRLAALN